MPRKYNIGRYKNPDGTYSDATIKQILKVKSFVKPCPIPELTLPCKLWAGATDGVGYGKLYVRGINKDQYRATHRESYRIYNGKEAEHMVLHKCGVKLCFEPTHLYDGDHRDNYNDAVEHGAFDGAFDNQYKQEQV